MIEWRDVPNFEDRYKISNTGILVAKSYIKDIGLGRTHKTKEKVVPPQKNKHGYLYKKLSKNGNGKIYKIHQIVAMAFLGFSPCGHKLYVDHKDRNKLNNNVSNLRIITPSESLSNREITTTSNYQGVSFDKFRNKWVVRANENGKYKFLGRFDTEETAYNVIAKRKGKTVNGVFIKD